MKQDAISKIYAGLTDKERAVLAFTYTMKHDEVELARIASSMQKQHFTGLPMEYRGMIYKQMKMAMMYAIVYWQTVARIQTSCAGALVKLQTDDTDAWQLMFEQLVKHEAELLSIEIAFDETCADHGLDPKTMRYMAGNQFYKVSALSLPPDGAYLEDMREMFAGMMA